MSRKTVCTLSIVVFSLLLASCTMTKDECKSTYGLVDGGTISPPTPGPKIILEISASNPTTLAWKIDKGGGVYAPMTGGGPIDRANPQLRNDFIGTTRLLFKVAYSGGIIADARHVVLTKPGVRIDIYRSSSTNKLTWIFTDTGTNDSYLLEPGSIPASDTLPDELIDLEVSGFKEMVSGVAGTGMTLQVNL